MLQPRPSPQSELEPTDAERQQIMRDAKARNAEGIVARFAERDLALMIELGLTRYRANKYQELLGPYFEICLQKIQKPAGTGPSPADYREAVATAEAQLRDVTGIVSPKSMMVPEVAGLVRHRP